jgi:MFS family permease
MSRCDPVVDINAGTKLLFIPSTTKFSFTKTESLKTIRIAYIIEDMKDPPKPPEPEKPHAEANDDIIPPQHQIGLVVFTALYATFLAGAFFGWGPMQLMLEDAGAFTSKCDDDEELPCDAQTLSLLNVGLVASLTPFGSPILGYISDRYGALRLMQILATAGTSGIALIVLASATNVDQLYYPAYSLIGIGYVATSIIIVQTGLVFRGAAQRRVISLLNGLVDAGSSTYLILYKIAEAMDASLFAIATGYLGVALFCFGGALYFWAAIVCKKEEYVTVLGNTELHTSDAHGAAMSTAIEKVDEEGEKNSLEEQGVFTDSKSSCKGKEEEQDAITENEQQSETLSKNEDDPDTTTTTSPESGVYIMVAQREPLDQLKSQQFILLTIFCIFHCNRSGWVLTTARDNLASLGDDEEGNKYLTIFTVMGVSSLVGLPFIDNILGKYGYHMGFQAINMLALLHGIIQLSSDNLNVQILGFVVFSFYRCFTFATVFSFLPLFLGGAAIGRGAGMICFWSALVGLLNIGLASWLVNGLEEDFFVINLLYTVFIFPVVWVAFKIGICIKREEAAAALLTKAELLDASSHVSIQVSKRLPIERGPEDENDMPDSGHLSLRNP